MNMLKQPKALSVFCLSEMWERYGFVMIESLLVLYLINVFGLSDDVSYQIMGSVAALAYLNAVFGGYIADRWIGHRQAILCGSLLLSLGYFLLSHSHSLDVMAWSLGMITMGTGLFKPNVSSIVGSLYTENDPRRHSGFTLFYVGINVGNMLGSSVPAYIQQYLGWNVTYLSATVMLLVAFATFYLGTRYFKIKEIKACSNSKYRFLVAGLITLVIIVFGHLVIIHPYFADKVFSAIAIASVVIVLYQAFHSHGLIRERILAYLVLVGMTVLFWALYFQIFFSMNLFIDRVVDRTLFGHTIPAALFISFEAFAVVGLGIIMSWVWKRLAYSRFNPGIPMKFTLGFVGLTLAFGLLCISSYLVEAKGLVQPGWVIVVYLVIALGELFLSAISLSMVTELVPRRIVGMMMGILFVCLGLGGKLAGELAEISAIPQTLTATSEIEKVYHHAFLVYFFVGLVFTIVSLSFVPLLKRLIKSTV